MALRPSSTFSSLAVRNFRLFLGAQAISMTGLWMQRIAQDWLVLSLTHDTFDVGLVTAVQCLPTLLFGYWSGMVGDLLPKRRVLLATQIALGSLAAVLAGLTLSGLVRTWQVFLFAIALGTVSVVDNPTRQAFVVEMVGADRIRNATSLSSSVFQLGALVGPAITGFMIQAVGVGCAFALNAASYVAPVLALLAMRVDELLPPMGQAIENARSAPIGTILRSRRIIVPIAVAGSFGLFLPNLPVTIAASTTTGFHQGPELYGLLNAVVAAGSLGGALYSASRRGNRLRTLVAQAGLLVIGYLALAAMTTPLGLAVALLPVGVVTMLVVTGANATVQLSAPRSSLGRIMGIYILVSLGTAALGGPLVGYVDHAAGPRVGYLLAAAVPAVVLMVIWLTTLRRPGSDARNASAPSSDRDRRVTRPGRNGSHPTRHRGREDDDEPGLRAGRVHDPRRQ